MVDGLPADVVALALALDIHKIADAGLIAPDWESRFPHNSVVSESTVAIVTRKGNPHNVQDWGDLTREGVYSVSANPKTAGGARWNFLALWGHQMARGPAAAERFVRDVFMNVVVQPRDAREASDAYYKQGVGDCLLTYENEVIATNWMLGRSPRTASQVLPYVVPPNNVAVENPVAVVDRVVDERPPEVREAAEAFVRFLYTDEAQREFARWGFRSVTPAILREQLAGGLPPVKTLWRVDRKLGGWRAAQVRLFDSGTVLDRIQREVGAARLEMQKRGVGLGKRK